MNCHIFLEIMKDHSSHDVVLLCVQCHQTSNIRDQVVREKLAVQCNAPLSSTVDKYVEDQDCKYVGLISLTCCKTVHVHS